MLGNNECYVNKFKKGEIKMGFQRLSLRQIWFEILNIWSHYASMRRMNLNENLKKVKK